MQATVIGLGAAAADVIVPPPANLDPGQSRQQVDLDRTLLFGAGSWAILIGAPIELSNLGVLSLP